MPPARGNLANVGVLFRGPLVTKVGEIAGDLDLSHGGGIRMFLAGRSFPSVLPLQATDRDREGTFPRSEESRLALGKKFRKKTLRVY